MLTAPTGLTITKKAEESDGLSTGAIIAIVISGVVVLIILALLLFYFFKKQKDQKEVSQAAYSQVPKDPTPLSHD